METKYRKGGKSRVEVPLDLVPKATEAEVGLACIAANYPNEFVAKTTESRFSTADILDPFSKAVVESITNQVAKGASCDIRVLFEKVRERMPSAEFYQVSDVCTNGAVLSALPDMLTIVRRHAKRRALLAIAAQLQHDIQDISQDTGELLSQTYMAIDALHREMAPARVQDTNAILMNALQRYETGDDTAMRVRTGYSKLDNLTPIRFGDFLVIGGETKSGKTMLALNIIANILNESNQSHEESSYSSERLYD
jgi:replicative DNA helicase